jgi:hypothetical protein
MLIAPCFDELEVGVLVVLADPGPGRATGSGFVPRFRETAE